MNDNFWTFLKIVAAVGATFLVYEFLDPSASNETNNTSLIDSSLEKLEDILSASIEDNDARRDARLEFQEFSDLVSEGEISPDQIEDIASSILNMRMKKSRENGKNVEEIIRALRRARSTSSFTFDSSEELEIKLDSIAIKINSLKTFQEEYYVQFLHSEILADFKKSAELSEIIESENIQVAIEFVPVITVPKTPVIANLRMKSKIVIIGEEIENIPPIQITDNLEILIDYSNLNMLDTLKIIEFHKKMNALESVKSNIIDFHEEDKDKSDNSGSK